MTSAFSSTAGCTKPTYSTAPGCMLCFLIKNWPIFPAEARKNWPLTGFQWVTCGGAAEHSDHIHAWMFWQLDKGVTLISLGHLLILVCRRAHHDEIDGSWHRVQYLFMVFIGFILIVSNIYFLRNFKPDLFAAISFFFFFFLHQFLNTVTWVWAQILFSRIRPVKILFY